MNITFKILLINLILYSLIHIIKNRVQIVEFIKNTSFEQILDWWTVITLISSIFGFLILGLIWLSQNTNNG